MRAVIALLGIVLFSMVAVMGFNGVLAGNTQMHTVENESWTPDAGNVTELEYSNLDATDYNDTVTVRNASGVEMAEGTDYEWYDSNGTIRAVEGGGLDGEDTATVTYGYERPPADQVMLSNIFAMIPNTVGALVPVFALVFLLLIVRGG